ncbi:MAG: PASTA domain-containing protein [Proteobacteria bacterium]|nr:PASTA domain-containing protein [Pseudomonadota bacterium]
MKILPRIQHPLFFLLMALACLLTGCVPSSPKGSKPAPSSTGEIGRITRIIGPGEVQINNRIVSQGAVMQSGDHIRTVGDARTTLTLARGGEVLFDADTDPVLEWLSTSFCKLRILINVGSMLVDTPCQTEAETGSGAVVNTIGTTFHLRVTSQWTKLTVIKGEMSIRSNVGDSKIVPAGFQCQTWRNQSAPEPTPADDFLDEIDWACGLNRSLCQEHSQGINRVPVPDLIGSDRDQARDILSRSGLKFGQIRETAAKRRSDDGRVANQSPKPGTMAPPGTEVDLYVYRYHVDIPEMPMLLNLPFQRAREMLKEAGIPLNRQRDELITNNQRQDNRVARQWPKAGSQMRPNTEAQLTIYRYERPPPPMTEVPHLLGMHIDKARHELERAGLNIGQTTKESTSARPKNGLVFRQKPSAGVAMERGARVDIWVYSLETQSMPNAPLPPVLLQVR